MSTIQVLVKDTIDGCTALFRKEISITGGELTSIYEQGLDPLAWSVTSRTYYTNFLPRLTTIAPSMTSRKYITPEVLIIPDDITDLGLEDYLLKIGFATGDFKNHLRIYNSKILKQHLTNFNMRTGLAERSYLPGRILFQSEYDQLYKEVPVSGQPFYISCLSNNNWLIVLGRVDGNYKDFISKSEEGYYYSGNGLNLDLEQLSSILDKSPYISKSVSNHLSINVAPTCPGEMIGLPATQLDIPLLDAVLEEMGKKSKNTRKDKKFLEVTQALEEDPGNLPEAFFISWNGKEVDSVVAPKISNREYLSALLRKVDDGEKYAIGLSRSPAIAERVSLDGRFDAGCMIRIPGWNDKINSAAWLESLVSPNDGKNREKYEF